MNPKNDDRGGFDLGRQILNRRLTFVWLVPLLLSFLNVVFGVFFASNFWNQWISLLCFSVLISATLVIGYCSVLAHDQRGRFFSILGSLPNERLALGVMSSVIATTGVSITYLYRDITGGASAIFMNAINAPIYLCFGVFLSVAESVSEEIIFRGYLIAWLRTRLGSWQVILISSALFALVHFEFAMMALGVRFMLGVSLGLVAIRTKSLLLPIVIHATYNTVVFIAFDLSH